MNKIIILGNVGRTAEEKKAGETALLNFPVATSKYSKKENGYVTTWHNVNLWGQAAEKCAGKIVKGCKILVEGEYLGRKYKNKEGQDVYVMEVHTWTMPQIFDKPQTAEAPATQNNEGDSWL